MGQNASRGHGHGGDRARGAGASSSGAGGGGRRHQRRLSDDLVVRAGREQETVYSSASTSVSTLGGSSVQSMSMSVRTPSPPRQDSNGKIHEYAAASSSSSSKSSKRPMSAEGRKSQMGSSSKRLKAMSTDDSGASSGGAEDRRGGGGGGGGCPFVHVDSSGRSGRSDGDGSALSPPVPHRQHHMAYENEAVSPPISPRSGQSSSSSRHHHHHHSHAKDKAKAKARAKAKTRAKTKDKTKSKAKTKAKTKAKDKAKDKARAKYNAKQALRNQARVLKSKSRSSMARSKAMTLPQGFQGVVTATSDSIIQSVNPYAAQMFGWQVDDLQGQRLEVLMAKHFAEQHHTFIRRHEERGVVRAIGITRRVEGLHAEGHTFNILLHVTEVTTAEGAPLYVALLEHDETPTGHTVIDSRGIISYVNTSMTDIFGFSKLELEGFNVSKLMPEPYASAHDSFIAAYEETGVRKVLDKVRHVPGLHKNGTLFPISLRVKALQVEDGRRYEALIDRVDDMECMMTFDSGGIIRSVTTSFMLMFGYETHELLGKHVSKLLGDMKQYEMSLGSFEAMAASLAAFESEMQRLKLGSRRITSYHKDGTPFNVCVTIQDYFPMEFVPGGSGVDDTGSSVGGSGDSRASVDISTRMFSAFFTPWVDPADLASSSGSSANEENANDMWREAGEDDTIEVSHPALSKYKFRKLIGKGSSGEVRLASDLRTKAKRAIKIVRTDKLAKDSIDLVRLINEISLLKVCDHPHIVKLYDVVETDTRMYIVMEFIDGADLTYLWHYDNPLEPGLSEEDARPLFIPIVQAIHYLHRQNIIHRDIKLDNIMLTKDGVIKLVDFGFATVCNDGELLSRFCGTPYYAEPAVFRNVPYDKRADVWSLGVVLYILLTGQMPFETPQAIVAGSYYMRPEFSPLAKDLLQNMLVVDFHDRFTISDVALHKWLRG